jgi:hypothetical protein
MIERLMNVEQQVKWEPEVLGGTRHSAAVSTISATWPDLERNPDHRGEKPALVNRVY